MGAGQYKGQNLNSGSQWALACSLLDNIHLLTILSLPGMTRLPGKTIVPGNNSCILGYLSSFNQQYNCYHNTLINTLLPKPEHDDLSIQHISNEGQVHMTVLSPCAAVGVAASSLVFRQQ